MLRWHASVWVASSTAEYLVLTQRHPSATLGRPTNRELKRATVQFPMTKKCSICRATKSVDSFNKKRRNKDGLQAHCRECSHVRFAVYYKANKIYHRVEVQKHKERALNKYRQYVMDYFATHPCVDCGETDPLVLEFDHVRGRKHMAVTKMMRSGYGKDRFLAEIAKCDVRCANCHRRVTYKRLGNCYRAVSSTG